MILSCGIVPVRFINGRPQFLLLENHSHQDFPKGCVEGDESPLDCAKRELKEESSLADPEFFWGTEFYETDPYSRPEKIARYYVARISPDAKVILLPNPKTGLVEHNSFAWLDRGSAKKVLKPRIAKVLTWATGVING